MASLQEAAFDESFWAGASAQIDAAAGIGGSHLAVLSRREPQPEFLFSRLLIAGEPVADIERRYVEEYSFRDERVPRLRGMPQGRLLHNTELYTDWEQKTSPVYCGFLPRVGSNNQVLVRLNGLHDTDIVWCLSAAMSRGWTPEQIGVVERLLPHVEYFVHVRQALAAADARGDSLTGLLERSSLGLLQLDCDGRVLEANQPAWDLLEADGPLRERDRRLRACDPADDKKLGRLLSSCCREGVGGSMRLLPFAGAAAGQPLVVHASPVPPDKTTWDTRGVAAQVLLPQPGVVREVDLRPVAEAYDLTPAEIRVAALLADGLTVREIAASTGRGESTIRWHVKNLHSKLGVHRQADLVRLVLSTAVAASAE